MDIITHGSGYSIDIYCRFLRSLLRSGFIGKVHLTTFNEDLPVMEHVVLAFPFVQVHVFDRNQPALLNVHVNSSRYLLWRTVLQNETLFESTEMIFLTDLRDVLFQRNISLYPYDNENVDMYVFEEDSNIRNESYTCHWVKQLDIAMGTQVFPRIMHKTVLCGGTIVGKINAIKTYVDKQCEIMLKFKIKENLDQGILNWIVYTDELQGVKIRSLCNTDGLVNTLALSPKLLNAAGQIVDSQGNVSYLAHQYDRMPKEQIAQLFEKDVGKRPAISL